MASTTRNVPFLRRNAIAALLFICLPAGAQTMSTVAGNGQAGSTGDGGMAVDASLNLAQGVVFDTLGNLYISDRMNHRIRKVNANGTITAFAGTGAPGMIDGPGAQARFTEPRELAADAAGNILVLDRNNNRVRKITPAGVVSTVAGGGAGGVQDNILATQATLAGPWGIAVDAAGNLYISDTGHYLIRKVSTDGRIRTIAGNGLDDQHPVLESVPATSSPATPFGIAADAEGNIYYVDINRIRRISAASGEVVTIAGNGVEGYTGNGGRAIDATVSPDSLAFDQVGNLYFTEFLGYVRRITPDGTIEAVAGTGVPGSGGDNGPAIDAQLTQPSDIAIDQLGRIAIADVGPHRIRYISASKAFMTAAAIDFVQSVDRPAWLMDDFVRELSLSVSAPRTGACALLGLTNARARLYRAARLLSNFDGTRIAGDSREIAQESDCRWSQ